ARRPALGDVDRRDGTRWPRGALGIRPPATACPRRGDRRRFPSSLARPRSRGLPRLGALSGRARDAPVDGGRDALVSSLAGVESVRLRAPLRPGGRDPRRRRSLRLPARRARPRPARRRGTLPPPLALGQRARRSRPHLAVRDALRLFGNRRRDRPVLVGGRRTGFFASRSPSAARSRLGREHDLRQLNRLVPEEAPCSPSFSSPPSSPLRPLPDPRQPARRSSRGTSAALMKRRSCANSPTCYVFRTSPPAPRGSNKTRRRSARCSRNAPSRAACSKCRERLLSSSASVRCREPPRRS